VTRIAIHYDPATGERVTATYLVTLVVPSNCFGQIEVESRSEEDAARLALDQAFKIDWSRPTFEKSRIEMFDVECQEEPEDTVLSRPGDRDDRAGRHQKDGHQ
jgi:hypothetical protein